MTGDEKNASGKADTDVVHIKNEKEAPKTAMASPTKKGWSTIGKVTVIGFIVFLLVIIPIAATLTMPTVSVIGAQIYSAGSGYSQSYVTVRVNNPNIVGVTVTHISGSFYVNGVYGGDFTKTDSVTIAARGSTDFNVKVTIKSAVPIHLNADNLVRVKGTAAIQGALTSWNAPFDDTKEVHFT